MGQPMKVVAFDEFDVAKKDVDRLVHLIHLLDENDNDLTDKKHDYYRYLIASAYALGRKSGKEEGTVRYVETTYYDEPLIAPFHSDYT